MDEPGRIKSAKIDPQEEQRFMRRVDWNLFRQFYEIVEAGSVSGAARRLNLRQPSLSAALKNLEGHLQVTLCRRTAQGVDLTPAGKAVMRLSAEMVETIRMARHLTSQAAHQVEGILSIWMVSNVISSEFDEALASIHRRHPQIKFRINIAPWRTILDAVSAGDCDLGITPDTESRPHLRYEPILRESQQLYCGRSHPLYGHRIRDPAVLSQEGFVLAHGDEPEELARFRRRYGLGKNATGHAEDLQEVLRLVELDIGLGFLPTVVANMSWAKQLWPLLPEALLPTYFIYLVAPPASRLSTPTQLFLDEMRRRLRAKPDLA